ncbi:S24 family peptidase [Sphingomonas jaspsi]|uniref:S24 family peptidase n=1 Tax=Sphingomonas jaspsi TaxID=392409 RepID=UPI00055DC379|nr:S24 family peptidase [Sphingomonas jaspsi]
MLPNPREYLESLCAERGENFAALSRLVGRNPAYIQQYVRKGTPKSLPERERRILARYFDIPEASLGGADGEGATDFGALVPVQRAEVFASAGPGAMPDAERRRPYFGFDQQWLRRLTASPAERLEVIRVEGDSMAPTLNAGDDILVDLGDAGERLRDGIYVLRVDGTLLVKRLAIHPVGRRVTVQSDNPAYGDLPDCGLDEIQCIGRVIWAGRKVA